MQYGEVAAFAMGIALLVVLMAIGVFVEKFLPAAACPIRGIVFNVPISFPPRF